MAAKNNEKFKEELNNLLVNRGFENIKFWNQEGEVPIPQEADAFQFNYVNGDHDLGSVTITIDNRNLSVYYNQSVTDPKTKTDSGWTNFLKEIRSFAQRRGQMGFKIDNLDKLAQHMKQREHTEKKAQLGESYYGNRTTSYSDDIPSIKMIIKHNRSLSENDARFRYIERIFLENEAGERLLVPSTKPSIGRVFATHLREGGEYRDTRWNHIAEITEDISKLGAFVRATRTKQYNEGVQRVIGQASDHYQGLRETVKKMQTSRGYNAYFEGWQPTLLEQETNYDFGSAFGDHSDPRIESALPVLGRLNIKLNEMSEMTAFEDWANGVIRENLKPNNQSQDEKIMELVGPESEALPIGPDAINAIGELEGIIEDDDLFDRLHRAAASNPDTDARTIIVAWMAEQDADGRYDEIIKNLEGDAQEEVPPAPEPAEEPQSEEPPPAEEPQQEQPVKEMASKKSKIEVPASKPRNFVAKNAPTTGAGAHKRDVDYKRQDKHRGREMSRQFDEAITEDDLARIRKLSGLK